MRKFTKYDILYGLISLAIVMAVLYFRAPGNLR